MQLYERKNYRSDLSRHKFSLAQRTHAQSRDILLANHVQSGDRSFYTPLLAGFFYLFLYDSLANQEGVLIILSELPLNTDTGGLVLPHVL